MIPERLKIKREDGYEVRVDINKPTAEYALDFLHIFNNVKSQTDLVRIWSDYGTGVYVVCRGEEMLEPLKEYLSQFGEIMAVNKVQIMSIDEYSISWDIDEYEELILDPVFE